MGKMVYSLMLAEDVVAMVDALAAREGYSRSALVNHILAEYVSFVTPEKANRQTMQALQQLAGAQGLRSSLSAGGTLNLKTALPYKYNPALNYTVELWREGDALGQLRVSLRSQNDGLLAGIRRFFGQWQRLEARYLPHPPPAAGQHLESRRYQRTLRRPQAAAQGEAVGESIARYINLMDNCIKYYFKYIDDDNAAQEMDALYQRGLAALGDAREL